MKASTETKASHPIHMRLFRLGPGDNSRKHRHRTSQPEMASEDAKEEEGADSAVTFYREDDSPTTDIPISPPRSTRDSIRHVTDGQRLGNSPKSPSPPLSNGITRFSPARNGPFKSPEAILSDTQIRSPGTPASDFSEGWSAVGKATVGGKSGKVIERLQSEIDQLKRGIRASEAKYDEARMLYDTVITERDELRASKNTLDSIRVVNEGLIDRRDRKIEQLKLDLEEEKNRRVAAETAERRTAEDASKRIQRIETERNKALDECGYFRNQYATLEKSMTQLRTEYQMKTKRLSTQSAAIVTKIEEDQQAIRKYEAGAEQLRANYERSGQTSRDMAAAFDAYRTFRDEAMSGYVTQADKNAVKLQELEQELHETCGRMKQVMSIKQTFKGEFRD